MLQGAGTAGGNVTNSGGTVRPGTSPGKLTIGGDYTQGPAGRSRSRSTAPARAPTYDRLAVGGDATLDGTLAIVDGPSFDPAPSDTFQVLTSVGPLTGTFASLTGAPSRAGTYAAQYTAGPPGRVRLALTAAPAPENTTPPSIPASATVGDT